MTYIVSQLMDEKEKKELQRMFKALDKDGNGMLDRQELIDGYEMIFGEAVDLEKIDEIFRTVDTDNSGFIDYNEFLVAAMSETKVMSNQNLREAFNLMDKVYILYIYIYIYIGWKRVSGCGGDQRGAWNREGVFRGGVGAGGEGGR